MNGRTKEEVDLSEMSTRAIKFLVARCTEDEEGRFVVEDIVVEVLDEAVHKFNILFQFSSFITHAPKILIVIMRCR